MLIFQDMKRTKQNSVLDFDESRPPLTQALAVISPRILR